MNIMLIHVKLQPKGMKSVEMGAKSVWLVKNNDFIDVFFLFFNFWSFLQAHEKDIQNVATANRLKKFQNVPSSLNF